MVSSFEFSGKHSNERVLFFGRAHILVLIQKIILPFSSFLFFCVLFYFVESLLNFSFARFFFIFLLLWQLFDIFSNIYCYFSSFFVITNSRVFAQKKKRIFLDVFQESVELTAIKETNSKQLSIFQMLFHFGDIHIGASGAPSFSFSNLSHSEDVSLYLDKIVSKLAKKEVSLENLPVFIISKKQYLESKQAELEQMKIQQRVKNLLGK